MSDLAAFLLARIAEDEERISAWEMRGVLWPHEEHDPGECDECDYRRRHRAADDALQDRLEAECEAKRRIIELHDGYHHCPGVPGSKFWSDQPCDTLMLFALPYRDHPEYDESWAP